MGCWGFMVAGREVELELEACGDRLVGRWVGVVAPWGEGDGLFEDLRLEPPPTRFLKRELNVDDIDVGARKSSRAGGGVVLLSCLTCVRLDTRRHTHARTQGRVWAAAPRPGQAQATATGNPPGIKSPRSCSQG